LILDAHCHLHEFEDSEIEKIVNEDFVVFAVSDDSRSSLRTIELSKKYRRVVPFIGVHPWSITADEYNNELRKVSELIERRLAAGLGEIGLDSKFRAETIEIQRIVFRELLENARNHGVKVINIHAVGTWREVLDLLYRYDVPTAIFHWYSGPVDLLNEIKDRGYFITVNPAIKIQEKHRRIAASAPLDIILLESDAPYNYRGIELHPKMIPETISIIAAIRGVSAEEIARAIEENSRRILSILGLRIKPNSNYNTRSKNT